MMNNQCYRIPQVHTKIYQRQCSRDSINLKNQNQGAMKNEQLEFTPTQNIKKRNPKLLECFNNQQGVNNLPLPQQLIQQKSPEQQFKNLLQEQEQLKIENEKEKQSFLNLKNQIEQKQSNLEAILNDILLSQSEKNEQQNKKIKVLEQQLKSNQQESFKKLASQFEELKVEFQENQQKKQMKSSKKNLDLEEIRVQINNIKEEIDSQKEILAQSMLETLESTKVEIEKLKSNCSSNDSQLQYLIQKFAQIENYSINISQIDHDSQSEQEIYSQYLEQQNCLSKQQIDDQDQQKKRRKIVNSQSKNLKQPSNDVLESMRNFFEKKEDQMIAQFEEQSNQMLMNLWQTNENQIQTFLQVELNKIINDQLQIRLQPIEAKMPNMILEQNTFKDQLKQISEKVQMIEQNQSKFLENLNNNCVKLDQSMINKNQTFDQVLQEILDKVKQQGNQIQTIQQIQSQQKNTENQYQKQINSQQKAISNISGYDDSKPKETPKQQKYQKTEKLKQTNPHLKEVSKNNFFSQEDDESSNQQDQFQQYQLGENNFQEINQEPGLYSQILHPNIQRLKMVQDFINEIYDKTSRQRSAQGDFRKFIRDEQDANQLYQNYGIKQSKVKKELAKICKSFRQVRGDGNCFYTAFGFQFCEILFYKYSQNEFEQFIQQMDQIISFKINYGQEKSIQSQELQKQCWDEFKFRLQYFRNKNNQHEFIQHFQAYEQSQEDESIDGCLYGLSTIFFRNLSNYLIDNSVFQSAVDDQQNLLIWEEECNSNEVVIQELAKFLQVHIKLVFFDQGSFYLREYLQGMPFQIILLIKPGHYNVGYQGQDIY